MSYLLHLPINQIKLLKTLNEYLDSIKNKDSVFYAKASGRVQTLKKNHKRQKKQTNIKKQ